MPRKLERAALLLALVASPFWIPALPGGFGGSLRAAVRDGVAPFFEAIHAAQDGFGRLLSTVLNSFSLQEENDLLRAQIETLHAHEGTHRELSDENRRLRQLLAFKAKGSWASIPAEVIGREVGPWSRGLLINKGTRDGVRRGMAVVTPVGLVGRVAEAGPSSSRVTLLTDPHFRVMGKIPEGPILGLVMGAQAGECVVTYLPLEERVAAGQTVLTTGGVSFAPAGIPIGVVRRVWKDPSDLYQVARLEPAARLGGIEEVLVVER